MRLLAARTLFAALAIQCCNGSLYAWSTFVPELRASYGLSATQAAGIFSTTMAFFTGMMVLAGPVQERRGPSGVLLLGGSLFALGYLVAARSEGSFWALLVGVGVLGGTAIGLGYVSALGACARCFPSHCGLVTGVVVAGFGISGMLVSQIASAQLAAGVDVLVLLGRMGAVAGAVVVGGGLLLWTPDQPPTRRAAVGGWAVLRDPALHSLLVGMFTGTFGGLLVVSNLEPLVRSLGAPDRVAAWAVGAFAVGNAVGRIVWGRIVDRMGYKAVPASLLCLCGALLALSAPLPPGALVGVCALVGACFGANFVVYAAQVARAYGPDGVGMVYPWVFLSYGLAGVIGPATGGWLADTLGDYRAATLLAALLAGLGVPAVRLVSRRERSEAPVRATGWGPSGD